MTAVVSPSEVTMELPVPPAVDQWRAEQGLPPLDVSKFEYRPRPPRPGCHDRDEWRKLMRPPADWPFEPMPPLPELECDRLFYDQFGVIRPRKRPSFRRHAARHTAAT